MTASGIELERLNAREYMVALGRAGGQKKSPKKTTAARLNAQNRWRKARKIKALNGVKKNEKKYCQAAWHG